MTIHFSTASSPKAFCKKKSTSAGCNSSCFGNFEMTLFALTDSINNCYYLPESEYNAEKDDDGDLSDK